MGFVLQQTVDRSKIGTTCVLIRGNDQPGDFLRTVIRADPLNVDLPSNVLCPSGYGLEADTLLCSPITTPLQLVVLLQADKTATACNATVAQFLQKAFFAYLTDASRSFGLNTANLRVL